MRIAYIDLQQLLYILRIFGIFTNVWPPHRNIRKYQMFLYDLYFYISLFLITVVCIFMVISAYIYRGDIVSMMKNLAQLAITVEAVINSIMCKIKRKQLQSLFVSIEEFMKHSKESEKIILQKSINRYTTFLLTVVLCFGGAAINVVFGPLFSPLQFPLDIQFPFSTESLSRKFVIYVWQLFCTFYVGCCLTMDVMIMILLSYSIARLKILAFKLQQAADETYIILCAKKHQEIIEYISNTHHIIHYLLFKTTFLMGFTVISGCFAILYLQSYFLIIQFLIVVIAALQRMYVTAWPADDLMETSMEVAWSAYNASWIGKSRTMKSNVFIILQRSQKPLVITMGAILPALTLEYYGNFVTAVMSYFMMIRTALAV